MEKNIISKKYLCYMSPVGVVRLIGFDDVLVRRTFIF